jgi:hypothetical protein
MSEQNDTPGEYRDPIAEAKALLRLDGPQVDHRKLADYLSGRLDAQSRQEVMGLIATYRNWDQAYTDMRILLAESDPLTSMPWQHLESSPREMSGETFGKLLDEFFNAPATTEDPLSTEEARVISAVYYCQDEAPTLETIHRAVREDWGPGERPSLPDIDDWLDRVDRRGYVGSNLVKYDRPGTETAVRDTQGPPMVKVFYSSSHPAEVFAETFRGVIKDSMRSTQIREALITYAKSLGLAANLIEILDRWVNNTFD